MKGIVVSSYSTAGERPLRAVVEVRSAGEILATLDDDGTLDQRYAHFRGETWLEQRLLVVT